MKIHNGINALIGRNPTWLATSCFCSKEKWSIILTEIRNIFEDLKHNVFSYHIQINNQYGDNITFFLLTSQEKIDDIGQKVRLNFEPLFASFLEERIKTPINSIILPFPINTFEFGLHVIYFDEKLLSDYKILEELSEVLIDGLKDEEILEDSLITISFYLHVSLIKACSKFLNKSEEWISVFFIEDNLNFNTRFRTEINENMDLVLEITCEIMENEKFEIEWLGRWYDTCYTTIEEKFINLKERDNIVREKIVREFYLKTTSYISHQIGLSDMRMNFVHKLLNYSLKRFRNKVLLSN